MHTAYGYMWPVKRANKWSRKEKQVFFTKLIAYIAANRKILYWMYPWTQNCFIHINKKLNNIVLDMNGKASHVSGIWKSVMILIGVSNNVIDRKGQTSSFPLLFAWTIFCFFFNSFVCITSYRRAHTISARSSAKLNQIVSQLSQVFVINVCTIAFPLTITIFRLKCQNELCIYVTKFQSQKPWTPTTSTKSGGSNIWNKYFFFGIACVRL